MKKTSKQSQKKCLTKFCEEETISDDVFCDNRKCADFSCMRWIKHAPYDEIIKVRRFKLDENQMCDYRIGGKYI